MQDKQKVTLYLPQELHRQLKVKAALALEPMSDLAERAINFYLAHPEVIEEHLLHGQTHRVYGCPECAAALVVREGDLVSLHQSGALTIQEELLAESMRVPVGSSASDEGQLAMR
jgi:hypothetical protein